MLKKRELQASPKCSVPSLYGQCFPFWTTLEFSWTFKPENEVIDHEIHAGIEPMEFEIDKNNSKWNNRAYSGKWYSLDCITCLVGSDPIYIYVTIQQVKQCLRTEVLFTLMFQRHIDRHNWDEWEWHCVAFISIDAGSESSWSFKNKFFLSFQNSILWNGTASVLVINFTGISTFFGG